jgi:hypothetical protein
MFAGSGEVANDWANEPASASGSRCPNQERDSGAQIERRAMPGG